MSEMAGGQVVSLAERLKQRREELGLSQAQAARELDVARTAYRLWELEAAKPQPDRWRLISRWLGVSVTTMLLADELDDTAQADALSAAFARVGSGWDYEIGEPTAFFARLRSLIREGTEQGFVSAEHAEELLNKVACFERERIGVDTEVWEPARLQKQFRVSPRAPKQARDAVDFVAADIPYAELHASRLLASELVTNSVEHGSSGDKTPIKVDIEVDRDRIRVEVRDGTPQVTEPTEKGGYGLAFVDRLSSRWATERESGGNLTWFEIDLPTPGAKPERP